MHAIVYLDATKLTGGRVAHVMQPYFDQLLIANIDGISLYLLPHHQHCRYREHGRLSLHAGRARNLVVRYALVGSTLADGMFAWVWSGINTRADLEFDPATFWTANGGVTSPPPLDPSLRSPVAASEDGRALGALIGQLPQALPLRSQRHRRMQSKESVHRDVVHVDVQSLSDLWARHAHKSTRGQSDRQRKKARVSLFNWYKNTISTNPARAEPTRPLYSPLPLHWVRRVTPPRYSPPSRSPPSVRSSPSLSCQ